MEGQAAYSTAEIARLLGVTVQAVGSRAKRESWQGRPRKARGGGSEWLLSSMPKATVDAIIAAQLAEQGVPLTPALTTCNAMAADPRKAVVARLSDLSQLNEQGRATVLARLAFVREVERMSDRHIFNILKRMPVTTVNVGGAVQLSLLG